MEFMEQYLTTLSNSNLFKTFDKKDISSILSCLSPTIKNYTKNEIIFSEGDTVHSIGIVLEGNLHIIKTDYWGNNQLLTQISESDMFGETFSCLEKNNINVNVISVNNSTVLFLDINRILTVCSSTCPNHNKIILNLLHLMAEKNYYLNEKVSVLTQRTIREKLLTFFSQQATLHNSRSFQIPFNRQQLADYLSVDRSAMSTELNKLIKEKILSADKSTFVLHINVNNQ